MNTLSFHLTDIASNSIRAGASHIKLEVSINKDNTTFRITDNGCGMDSNTIKRVTNPFYTTRTTRKVGLGLPFLIQNAEQTGGSVEITSEPGKGTVVTTCFVTSHIDCPPMGNLAETITLLLTGNPDIDFCFEYRSEEIVYLISTVEIKEILDGIPLNLPKVALMIKEMIEVNIQG